jgi:hypothetical protein
MVCRSPCTACARWHDASPTERRRDAASCCDKDVERSYVLSALEPFNTGQVPEAVLRAAVGAGGIANLREAAGVIAFDPERQAWRWHATVAAYAARHWSPDEAARRDRLAGLMDAWRVWLANVEPGDAERRLTAERANLELLTEKARSVPVETARASWRRGTQRCPRPTARWRCAIQAPLYRALVDLARDDSERAGALNNLGVALRCNVTIC